MEFEVHDVTNFRSCSFFEGSFIRTSNLLFYDEVWLVNFETVGNVARVLQAAREFTVKCVVAKGCASSVKRVRH